MHGSPLSSLNSSRHSLLVTFHWCDWYIRTNGKINLTPSHPPNIFNLPHHCFTQHKMWAMSSVHSYHTTWALWDFMRPRADSSYFEIPFLAVNLCKLHLFFPTASWALMRNSRKKQLTDAIVGGLLASQHLTGPGGQHVVFFRWPEGIAQQCWRWVSLHYGIQEEGKSFVSWSWFEIALQTQALRLGLSTSLCTMQNKTEWWSICCRSRR